MVKGEFVKCENVNYSAGAVKTVAILGLWEAAEDWSFESF
jgi:hypothetical protein